jgi:anaerobic magnesium-protoporphyrin IX monomethyl ester cyclase
MQSAGAVGMHVYTYACEEAAIIAQKIKELDPSIPLIIGGPHPTIHSKTALSDIPAADISVEGEGEHVINDVVEALQGRKNLSEVNGVQYREKNTIKRGKLPVLIEDIDSIPFPSRHLTDKYEKAYGRIHNAYFLRPLVTAIATTRGCPHKCRFCSRHTLTHIPTYKRYRVRSAENVINEFVEINEKYQSAFIVDENFLADKKRAHKIMDGLIDHGTTIELFVEGTRVDSAEEELYRKMKKANVRYLGFGIESGNQDVLDFYNKKITLEQVRTAVVLANKMNIITRGTFIFGAPLETTRHFENTIKFACSIPLDIAVFCPLAYAPGSDLYNEAVQQGILHENDRAVIACSEQRLGNFTKEELEQISYTAFKRFYFRPRYMIHELIKMVKSRDFRLVKMGLNYL